MPSASLPAAERMTAPPRLRPVAHTPAAAFAPPAAVAETAPPLPSSEPDTVRLHEIFLEEMAAAHAAFLRACAAEVPAVFTPPAPAPLPAAAPVPPAAAAAVAPPPPAAPIASSPAGARAPTGPRYSREQLVTLASGKISDVFGPLFAGQDGFHRQVRMPMPPMLLADRVTGIDAVPGKLGTGTIWTETDVTPGAWYLHHDRMPLGITIESGQADLLLISWMGIDLFNRSDRIYRLLGCEATVKGPLPKIGDTLRFDIHVEGHAQLGGIRMFFFRSDLRVGGEVRLSVRHGQAGFFTDEELAASEGVIWDAHTAPVPALRDGGHVLPAPVAPAGAFNRDQVRAFAAGRLTDCFGPAFARADTHTRTPTIPAGRLQLIDEVTHFDPAGGPWKRGYLRATLAITPDLWFFEGHFKNDPCMPGTLMLDGALQAITFYLAALGTTLTRDGWRFETAKDETLSLRCRGQCTPASRELVYEIFIEQFIDGPSPRVRATVLGSVDGLKALLCEGITVELVPDWPLDGLLRSGAVVATDAAPVFTLDGFPYDHRSLLACALGRPSESFGPSFRPLDGPLRSPRLPRPPYHFMTRIVACHGELGQARAGAWMECDYDFRADEWYFAKNAAPTMPACVFMEALLQPCGWLSSFARDIRAQSADVFFRNLDGTLTWTDEILPRAGTLRVRTELTKWSALGPMIIVGFRVEARLGGLVIASMETSFGFFPGDAFVNQAGVPADDHERALFALPANSRRALRGADAAPWPSAGPALAVDPILMLDRITGWWPGAGAAGLGVARAEKDVRAGDWFFQAHFMNDPVQPGSLGIEALLQLLQCAMRLHGHGADLPGARFEPVALGEPLVWKYRGQVVPENRLITSLVELTRVDRAPDGAVTAHARGSLWVDGKKIYETTRLAMRVRAAAPAAPTGEREFSLAGTPWLDDHRPSFAAAVVPLTVMLDELAASARQPAAHLVEIGAFFPSRWLVCPDAGSVRIRTESEPAPAGTVARLSVWRQARREELSRFDPVGETALTHAAAWPEPPPALPALDAPEIDSPYVTRETTHGPAFRLLKKLRRSAAGASARFDASAGGVPVGELHPALLDGCAHIVPLSRLAAWWPGIEPRWNGLPRGIRRARFFRSTPRSGEVRVEVRPEGRDAVTGVPLARAQFIAADRVWCELELEFALLDATPFIDVPFAARHAFLRSGDYRAIRFSAFAGGVSSWSKHDVVRYQWMPRQLETLFALPDGLDADALAEAVTVREHVAHALQIHPSKISHDPVSQRAATPHLPLQSLPLTVRADAGRVQVSDAGAPEPRAFADGGLFRGAFAGDVARALTRRYVRHFRLEDPQALEPFKGRPFVFCSNHQTALESLVFTDLIARWSGLPLTTVTRQEHRESWMGRLNDFLWNHPHRTVMVNPQLLFDRDRPESFLGLMESYKTAQAATPHSLHLHVEGEQARDCRHRVRRISSVVVDVALDLGLPVVPVKFSGGLPVETLGQIISFPFGYGRQDYTLGRPIPPEKLRGLPRPRAAELVADAINRLAPAPEADAPMPAEPAFAERIRALVADRGVTEIQAGLIAALAELPDASDATRSMLAFPESGAAGLRVPADEHAWHAAVAGWLWGRDDARRAEAENWKRTARV